MLVGFKNKIKKLLHNFQLFMPAVYIRHLSAISTTELFSVVWRIVKRLKPSDTDRQSQR